MLAKDRREGGTTRRQKRAGEFMRRTIGRILLQQELPDAELNDLSITVTEVVVSPDMRQARVYFLPLGGGDTEVAREALERNRSELQRLVALKYAPRLSFIADASFDRSDRVRDLLNEIGVEQSGRDPG